jgi:molybdenum cofactor biosynthesis protein B
VITVSDTRTLETDTGGARIAEQLAEAGHPIVSREIVPDDPDAIAEALRKALSRDETAAVILTGGTGVAPRDVTPEAVEPLLRALAGITSGRVVFVLPGSRGAVELAMEKLILPEIGHLAAEAVKIR